MDDEVRCIYRPGGRETILGDGAPTKGSDISRAARQEIAQFLDGVLMRPLHFSKPQQQMRIEQSLDTMTQAERVYLEIEMQARARTVHSFDYDPLRNG